MIRHTTLLLLMLLMALGLRAQTSLRIHQRGGLHLDIPLERIDSLTFVDHPDSTAQEEATLTGSWLWGSREAGYYELLTLNADNTFTGYDNYFGYGFDTWTYGWYARYGAMLTLFSNGYGYQRRYTWYVTALTANALGVMTPSGPFTYYRLQADALHLQAAGTPLACTDGDTFVFADGVVADIVDNQLHALLPGTTYILKHIAATDQILAFQVVVE